MRAVDTERRVSVVCLTYARRWTIEWQKALWSPYPIDLIIADGSPDIAKGYSSGTSEACRWQVFDMPGATYAERLRKAADAIATRHAIIIDDEEAYLYSGLARASQRLDDDPASSCAGGSAAYMRSVDGRTKVRRFAGRIADWSTPFELEEPAPELRIERMLSTYRTGNIFYSVVRAGFLKDFAAAGPLPEIDGTLIGFEYLWTAALAAVGTYSMGAYPFWFRMGGSQPGATRLRVRLTDHEIYAIANRIEVLARLAPGPTSDAKAVEGALRRGIRVWEERVFGPQMPSPDEARRRSEDSDYLRSFISPESYLSGFGEALTPSFAEELQHVVRLAQSPVRPAGSLNDAMA